MRVRDLGLGILEIVQERHEDSRGFFAETYQKERFHSAGITSEWVQENHSLSVEKGVLRGLHFQLVPDAQDKLIRVLKGSVFDVAVDLRPDSPSFGRWTSCILSEDRYNQLFIPKGFAHGFLTLEPNVEVFYKVSATYAPGSEACVAWNDPDLAIVWPLDARDRPLLSPKDANAPRLSDIAALLAF